MIQHTVYFWLDQSLTSEQKTEFEGGLRALFDISTVVTGHFGKVAGTPAREGVTQNDYDYALLLQFDTVEAHNSYQVDPDHDVFIKKFSPWFKTVRVYDTALA